MDQETNCFPLLAAGTALGTLAAIWENPFFVWVTSSVGWEVGLPALLSALAGFCTAFASARVHVSRIAGLGGASGSTAQPTHNPGCSPSESPAARLTLASTLD